jgi:hypothetical protein
MKIKQIVMKGDPRSEEYAEISRASFAQAIKDGYIESIETFDAITPDSPDFEEHCAKYNWAPSLMQLDLESGKNKDDHSPTEKAGMCSHWELMRQQGEQDDMFWIIEHDTFLLPERYGVFKALASMAPNMLYSNIGLFMGMYSMDRRAAHWMYHILTNRDFPINCGPYCTLQRLFRTFTTDYLEENDYFGMHNTAIHPWHNCDTLTICRNIGLPFNGIDQLKRGIPTPTTQVISKRLCVTQDHHGYNDIHIEQPWTRHKFFHVID